MSTKVRVRVTDYDIRVAGNCACHCPVGKAARRAIVRRGLADNVYAEAERLIIRRGPAEIWIDYPPGGWVQDRISEFDDSFERNWNRTGRESTRGSGDMEPFEFTVVLP